MSFVVGNFDVVAQVREGALQRLFQAMHAQGSLIHRDARAYDDKVCELQIQAPHIALDPALHPDGRMHAKASTRVAFYARPSDDATSLGTRAVADVTLEVAVHIPGGDPAPVMSGPVLVTDLRETSLGDIIVHHSSATVRDEVSAALLHFIHSEGSAVQAYPVPPLGISGQQVGSLAFRTIDGPEPVLAVGLNIGQAVKGSRAELRQAVVHHDWALAVSHRFFLDRLARGIRDQLGGLLPPPYGPEPVTLQTYTFCLIPGLYGGCLDEVRAERRLERLDLALQEGNVVITGTLAERTQEWYVPDVTADFRVEASVSLEPPSKLRLALAETDVILASPWRELLAMLSLDQLLTTAVESALQIPDDATDISALFSSQVLQQLASLGSGVEVGIMPRAVAVDVRDDAVVVHGTIDLPATTRQPHVSFSTASVPGNPTALVLHAGASWAPGGTVVECKWDFGDGASEAVAGDDLTFVTSHDYEPGLHTACVTVTDDNGRSSQACAEVDPGILVLRRLMKSGEVEEQRKAMFFVDEWTTCEQEVLDLTLAVTAHGVPVPGADVLVHGAGWSHRAQTDGQGLATLKMSRALFEDGVQLGSADSTVVGAIEVKAESAGFLPASRLLTMRACSNVRELLDPLLGDLKELVNLADLLPPPKSPVPPLPPFQPIRASAADDARTALMVLAGLARLIQTQSEALPISALLGIDPTASDASRQLAQRLGRASQSVRRSLGSLSQTRDTEPSTQHTGPNRARHDGA